MRFHSIPLDHTDMLRPGEEPDFHEGFCVIEVNPITECRGRRHNCGQFDRVHGLLYFFIGLEVEELNMVVVHSAKHPLSEHPNAWSCPQDSHRRPCRWRPGATGVAKKCAGETRWRGQQATTSMATCSGPCQQTDQCLPVSTGVQL